MATIKCRTCGKEYDAQFPHCPYCGASTVSDQTSNEMSSMVRKRFTKVGDGGLNQKPNSKLNEVTMDDTMNKTKMTSSVPIVNTVQPTVVKHPIVQPVPVQVNNTDEEDDEEYDAMESFTPFRKNPSPDSLENNDKDEDDEDENIDNNPVISTKADDIKQEKTDEVKIKPSVISVHKKTSPIHRPKVIGSPNVKSDDTVYINTQAAKPLASSMNARTAAETTYDPNHDGYYDDRLPAILDEVAKTSHMDIVVKSILAVLCVAALIAYCIFYVNV